MLPSPVSSNEIFNSGEDPHFLEVDPDVRQLLTEIPDAKDNAPLKRAIECLFTGIEHHTELDGANDIRKRRSNSAARDSESLRILEEVLEKSKTDPAWANMIADVGRKMRGLFTQGANFAAKEEPRRSAFVNSHRELVQACVEAVPKIPDDQLRKNLLEKLSNADKDRTEFTNAETDWEKVFADLPNLFENILQIALASYQPVFVSTGVVREAVFEEKEADQLTNLVAGSVKPYTEAECSNSRPQPTSPLDSEGPQEAASSFEPPTIPGPWEA